MSAYGCCGEYNEHSEKCVTVKYSKALIEISTLTAKVIELEEKLKNTEYNLVLRTIENHDIINNHDESRWTYWRKRSGEMTDAWRDQRDLALSLTAKVKLYQEALEFYADLLSWDYNQAHDDMTAIESSDCEVPEGLCDNRGGKRARAALNKGEGK